MPAIQRLFLDWTAPALPAAVDWLLAHAPAKGDLTDTIVVVPGSRAGRRLLEILVQKADEQDIGLSPPNIVTMGALPELLYPPLRPFADDLTQRLAWVEALRRVGRDAALREEIQQFIPAFPSGKNAPRLLELADTFRAEHLELAADDLDFNDVARQTLESGHPLESSRWNAFRKMQRLYLDVLEELKLWDKQTARLEAIKRNECATDKRIVLLGTVDMNRAARRMLDQVAEHITALLFAPQSLQSRFDAHGCVEPDQWAAATIDIDDDRIAVADDPIDQADEVARAIASWNRSPDLFETKEVNSNRSGDLFHGYRGDEITIGVCDERIVPQITRQLDQCGLTARWGPGRAISDTAPFRLLRGVADFLERGLWRDFAALVRHADVEAWLNAQAGVKEIAGGDWLAQLDDYQAEHVQTRLGGGWLGEEHTFAGVKSIHEAISQWLHTFSTLPQEEAGRSTLPQEEAGPLPEGEGDGVRPLTEWPPLVMQLLLTIYGERKFNRDNPADRVTLAALEKIHEALLNQKKVTATTIPKVTAAEAIRWALDSVAGDSVAPPADPNAIELLGWLELALDDAPALVVTTLNEGHVPKSSTGDMFLPDSLRTQLGLDDNARRYARDAYALTAVLASREVRLIVGRRDGDNYPLAPSRLLLACDDDTLIRRANMFFRPPPALAAKRPLAGALTATRATSTFVVPPPQPLAEPIDSLRVTQFRDYIACPYRFYLKHVVDVKAVDDAADELDGGMFGGLAHDVLKAFGLDDRRHTTSAEEIAALLEDFLQALVRANFGSHPRPAVMVQIEQLRRRLQALARIQADRTAAGWRIAHVECDVKCPFTVDGQPFEIRGRIDRIDVHEALGRWAIWDYKSSDTAKKPASTHRKKDAWVDLQLPLYRYLAASVDGDVKSVLEIDGRIQLGYIQLPKSAGGVKFEPAEWALADLASADDRARGVVRDIRAELFTPPTDPPPDYSEELAGICLDGVFGRTSQ